MQIFLQESELSLHRVQPVFGISESVASVWWHFGKSRRKCPMIRAERRWSSVKVTRRAADHEKQNGNSREELFPWKVLKQP